MNYRDIPIAISYCKERNYFYASSVFLLRVKFPSYNGLCICLIYNDRTKIEKIVKSKYHFICFSVQDIFTMMLQRDIQIVVLFSSAIPLLDKANIAPKIYSSLTPIKLFNKFYMNMSLCTESRMTETNESFSILFRNVDDPQSFINKTFIPLCLVLKEQLANCRFNILWEADYSGINCSAELRFFSDKILVDDLINKLQIYLYKNVSELQLGQIKLPYYNQQLFLKNIPKCIRDITNNILCALSEDFIELISTGGATDNKRITMVIYYYIIAAKSFFSSEKEFLVINEFLLAEMLDEGISPFSKYILNHQIVSDVHDKLWREYRILSDRTKVELWGNYSELLKDWSYIDNDDDTVSISLQAMKKIRNSINNDEVINETDFTTRYFVEFYKLLILSWNIPCYYRAYIPFCVKYLMSYEI